MKTRETYIYVKLGMLVPVAGPFGHKQSFWWKQVCLSENEHNAC